MGNKEILGKVIKYFLSWRIVLFVISFLATLVITKFGGRFPYTDRVLSITHLPDWIWGFGNFDGVHYLRLAQNGYEAQYSQAFFPLYPLLIRFFNFFPKENLDLNLYTDPSYFYTGLSLSAVFFIPALYLLFKLWGREYSFKIAGLSIILLLSFPTSFYFGAIYTESLFLLLAVLTFWFTREGKFIPAGIAAALASSTKIQGVLLSVFLLIELWEKYREKLGKLGRGFWKDILGLAISPMGLTAYMYYLYRAFGDPVYFLTAQPAFGADRSGLPLVSLPQVFYRYAKMLLSISPASLSFWNAAVELFFVLVLIVALIISFRKIKFSYWLFAALSVFIPTMTGTFSSVPRYALLAFPLLPLIAKFNDASRCKASRYIIIAQVLIGVVLLTLFIRGYWVA